MSKTDTRALVEFEQLMPVLETISPEEARKQFAELTRGLNDRKYIKGRDIAAAVIAPLVSMGASPEYPPIFRLNGRSLEGFLDEFQVSSVDALQESTPVYLSGTVVNISYPTQNQLDDYEEDILGVVATDETLVRIQFVPQDI